MKIVADAGATKIDWRIITGGGVVLKRETEGVNASLVSSLDNLPVVASRLMRVLSLPEEPLDELWFYGAGMSDSVKKASWMEALKAVLGAHNVYPETDMVGAARAVLGHLPGIACILGTGSNSCVWNGEEIVSHVHPGGFILGDEGSGAYLGKLLLSDWIRGLVPVGLSDTLEKAAGLSYPLIVNHVYSGAAPSRYLASFAPFIRDNINHPYCRSLVSGAFDAFIQRNILLYGEEKSTLAFVGSIAEGFREILLERVEAAGFEMGEVMASPADGLVRYHFGL